MNNRLVLLAHFCTISFCMSDTTYHRKDICQFFGPRYSERQCTKASEEHCMVSRAKTATQKHDGIWGFCNVLRKPAIQHRCIAAKHFMYHHKQHCSKSHRDDLPDRPSPTSYRTPTDARSASLQFTHIHTY